MPHGNAVDDVDDDPGSRFMDQEPTWNLLCFQYLKGKNWITGTQQHTLLSQLRDHKPS